MEDREAVKKFMKSSIVHWLYAFHRASSQRNHETLEQLAEGVFLNEVMAQMEPKYFSRNLNDVREEVGDKPENRQHNLGLLLESLTEYYQEELHTVVLLELPIVSAISRDPGSEKGLVQLKRFLQLILGVSVQCSNRERYIEQIKTLPSAVQIELMQEIQRAMEGLLKVPWDAFDEMSSKDLGDYCRATLEHLNHAVAVRDAYAQQIDDVTQEKDFLESSKSNMVQTPNSKMHAVDPNFSARHYETIRDLKTRMRSLSDELDQKTIQLDEYMQQEIKDKQQISDLNNKVRQLTIGQEEFQQIRDDLEIYRTKASEGEKAKLDLVRVKAKLEDLDYARTQIEELREQNNLLMEQNKGLKSASSSSQQAQSDLAAANRENRSLSIQVEELEKSQEKHFAKIRELNSEKVRLESENQHHLTEICTLQAELEQNSFAVSANQGEIVTDHASRTDMLRLEAENVNLKNKLEELKAASSDMARVSSEKETAVRQCVSLQTQMKELEDEVHLYSKKCANMQSENEKLRRSLEKAVKSKKVKDTSLDEERSKMSHLEKQLDNALAKSVELKEERIKVLNDRLKDSLMENTRLREDVGLYKKHNEILRQASSSNMSHITSPVSARKRVPYSSSPLHSPMGRPTAQLDGHSRFGGDGRVRATSMSNLSSDGKQMPSGDNGTLQREIVQLQDEVDTLRSENQAIKGQLSSGDRKTHEDVIVAQEKAKALEQMNATLSEQVKSSKESILHLSNENAQIKEREVQLGEKVKLLTQFKEALEHENKVMMAQLNKLLLQNQELLFKHVASKDKLKEKDMQFQKSQEQLDQTAQEIARLKLAQSKKKKGFSARILKKLGGAKRGSGNDISAVDISTIDESMVNATNVSIARKLTPQTSNSSVLGVAEFLAQTKQTTTNFIRTPARPPVPFNERKDLGGTANEFFLDTQHTGSSSTDEPITNNTEQFAAPDSPELQPTSKAIRSGRKENEGPSAKPNVSSQTVQGKLKGKSKRRSSKERKAAAHEKATKSSEWTEYGEI